MSPDSWEAVRSAITEQEHHIETAYGLPIEVYGTGSQGYELLASCLNRGEYWVNDDTVPATHIWSGSGQRSRTLQKQAHEYWTFLTIAEHFLDGHWYEGDRGVTYQPTQGDCRQPATLPTPDGTVFVEPCLTGYEESRILDRWEHRLEFLTAKKTRNVRPDFLIGAPDVLEIPWGAWTYYSGGLADEQQHEEQWDAFRDNVQWIVECKPDTPKRRDLSQALWYALAYETPVMLVVQDSIDQETRQTFQADAAQLDTPVRTLVGYQIGDRSGCTCQISQILD